MSSYLAYYAKGRGYSTHDSKYADMAEVWPRPNTIDIIKLFLRNLSSEFFELLWVSQVAVEDFGRFRK